MSPIAAGLLFAAGLWIGGCSLFLWVLFRSLRRIDAAEDQAAYWDRLYYDVPAYERERAL